MNILSLFDGISCGRVALERVGIKVDKYYASEIDKNAIKIAMKNYPDTIQTGDIYNIDYSALDKIDIVIGGSPCVYWSIAKDNREISSDGLGFDLFMQYVKAIEICKPKYFLYENNYSIHKNIKEAISKKLGVNPIMINSSLVSGQQRKREYWTNIPNIKQPEDKKILLKDILCDKEIIYHRYNQTITEEKSFTLGSNPQCLTSKTGQTVIKPLTQTNNKNNNIIYHIEDNKICLNGKFYKINLSDGDYIIRKLTPIECEKLQTLPENYTEGISNTQRYKCIGNGWTVDVIAHIFKGIKGE